MGLASPCAAACFSSVQPATGSSRPPTSPTPLPPAPFFTHPTPPLPSPTGPPPAPRAAGPHGEPNHDNAWFFRHSRGPKIRCFDARKDINIPSPNIHFPRAPHAGPLPALPPPGGNTDRPLLLFYAGWNYAVRMDLVRRFKDDPDPSILVRQRVPPEEYRRNMMRAR